MAASFARSSADVASSRTQSRGRATSTRAKPISAARRARARRPSRAPCRGPTPRGGRGGTSRARRAGPRRARPPRRPSSGRRAGCRSEPSVAYGRCGRKTVSFRGGRTTEPSPRSQRPATARSSDDLPAPGRARHQQVVAAADLEREVPEELAVAVGRLEAEAVDREHGAARGRRLGRLDAARRRGARLVPQHEGRVRVRRALARVAVALHALDERREAAEPRRERRQALELVHDQAQVVEDVVEGARRPVRDPTRPHAIDAPLICTPPPTASRRRARSCPRSRAATRRARAGSARGTCTPS